MVAGLRKPGSAVLDDITPMDADMLHMVLGMAGEVGEIVDAVKKAAIYCKNLDIDNIKEELGDLEFYMEGLRQIVGLTRGETLAHNLDKLAKRYPGYTYTNERAIARADKELE
jgi:NTP pyrophosphatase (non-canonical NTP hydrolase)